MIPPEVLEWRRLNEQLPIRPFYLDTIEGMSALEDALKKSNGAASVIIHPLFPESADKQDLMFNPFAQQEYTQYLAGIQESIRQSVHNRQPIILFEEEARANTLNLINTMQRIGFTKGNVFVVKTKISDPAPVNIDLYSAAQSLQKIGLKKAYLSGSYFYPDYRSTHPKSPGCVTATDRALRMADIDSYVDVNATFKKQYQIRRTGGSY